MSMKKFLTVIISCAVLVLVSHYFIFSKTIPKPNPLSYKYDFPIGLVREEIYHKFSNDRFFGMYFESGYNRVESSFNKLLPNENRNNFFINWYGMSSAGKS